MPLSRRDAFRLGGLGVVGVAGLAVPLGNTVRADAASLLPPSRLPKPYQATFQPLTVLQKLRTRDDGLGPIDVYDQRATVGAIRVIPGISTPVFGYDGHVPGYRIDVNQGTRIELTMRNRLPRVHPDFGTSTTMSTHLHGSASLPEYDGYANDVTQPGQRKTYHYPNIQPARTLWYHDHGVHVTAENVYSGLATQYHLHDKMERDLLPTYDASLPDGGPGAEYDVGLMISDMMFQANGHQLFDDRSHSGLWGDVILVNGQPWPVMRVKKRMYRFRVLDASVSRSYRFTLSPQVPMRVVATDGGLIPRSQEITQWRHGSAERYEILINFTDVSAGTRVELKNLSNPDNRDFSNTGKVMAFDVVDGPVTTNTPAATVFPDVLNRSNPVMALTERDAKRVRNIAVLRDQEWNLNGMTWAQVEQSNFTKVIANPDLNDVEIWEFENKSGGWFHPMHIHLVDFKILSRNGKPPFAWELGPKDTVYTGENEKLRLVMRFGPHRGRYMIHCHNTVHEDHDMMSQFSVGLDTTAVPLNDPHDPIKTDPPVNDTTV
jgi:FtsP/CotA-like multicopper oxidase with cupredoxin domain